MYKLKIKIKKIPNDLESRRVLMEQICKSITSLLSVEMSNEDRTKIDVKLEAVGKVLTELMDVIEKKNIVNKHIIHLFFVGSRSLIFFSKGNITQDINEICLMIPHLSSIFLYFSDNSENKVIKQQKIKKYI